VAIALVVMGNRRPALLGSTRHARAARRIKFILGMPLTWLVLALIHAEPGIPRV
jgi:hypothetical protein